MNIYFHLDSGSSSSAEHSGRDVMARRIVTPSPDHEKPHDEDALAAVWWEIDV